MLSLECSGSPPLFRKREQAPELQGAGWKPASIPATVMRPTTRPQAVNWDAPGIAALVRAALDEDLGGGDATGFALLPAEAQAKARLIAKQTLVLAGLPLFERVFRALEPGVRFEARFDEGARVAAGSVVAIIEGRARGIL